MGEFGERSRQCGERLTGDRQLHEATTGLVTAPLGIAPALTDDVGGGTLEQGKFGVRGELEERETGGVGRDTGSGGDPSRECHGRDVETGQLPNGGFQRQPFVEVVQHLGREQDELAAAEVVERRGAGAGTRRPGDLAPKSRRTGHDVRPPRKRLVDQVLDGNHA